MILIFQSTSFLSYNKEFNKIYLDIRINLEQKFRNEVSYQEVFEAMHAGVSSSHHIKHVTNNNQRPTVVLLIFVYLHCEKLFKKCILDIRPIFKYILYLTIILF